MPTPAQAPRREDLGPCAEGAGPTIAVHVDHGGRGLGLIGAVLACATALAALLFGVLAVFVTPLIGAALLTLVWPVIFSEQFTGWVFGTPYLPFWKAFLLFLLVGAVVRFHRWSTSGELWRRR
ncbi:MAG: hypothetical protein HY748_13335 [Elusimicrobia bacterium]|nr:hypothetical protein [Elusimicrobiota bacterium]